MNLFDIAQVRLVRYLEMFRLDIFPFLKHVKAWHKANLHKIF